MKVTIVGAGIIGLSAAWALTRNGHQVTVFDQGPIPNPASASYDQHRMIRPHYGQQTGYTRMVGQALAAWDELWADLGTCHYKATGVLAVELGAAEWMRATREALAETETPFEELDSTSIGALAPVLDIPKSAWGLLAPNAGILFADRIVCDLAAKLIKSGATLYDESRVASVDFGSASITLEDGQIIGADRLVIAAGAWAPSLVPNLSSSVQSVRSSVTYVSPPANMKNASETGPALFLLTKTAQLYALPPVGGTSLKFGGAAVLRPQDPNLPFTPDEHNNTETLRSFQPYLRDAGNYEIKHGAGACYADPADKQFIVQSTDRTLVITGCGGRMFKFGSLFGLQTAAWVDGKLNPDDFVEWAKGSF